MIKADKNSIEIEGTRIDLLSEFMSIAHMLVEEKVAKREDIQLYTALALATKKEINNALKATIDEMEDMSAALSLMGLLS